MADPGTRVGTREPGTRVRRAAKRAVDIVAAIPLLILALPLVALGALLVLLTDGRPVFFSQRRVGLDGKTFRLFKVRTMRRDAEEHLASLLASDHALAEEFTRYMCLKDDPRVLPRGGRFLRSASIDELPQLLNVLGGSMSMVGPRPLPPTLLEDLPPDHVASRLRVKPGLTGLWQVCGRSTNDVSEWIRLDGDYARTWSLRRDLVIMLRTPRALLSRRGAH